MRRALEYNGESKVKEKDCEDSLKIKVLGVKLTDSEKGIFLQGLKMSQTTQNDLKIHLQ